MVIGQSVNQFAFNTTQTIARGYSMLRNVQKNTVAKEKEQYVYIYTDTYISACMRNGSPAPWLLYLGVVVSVVGRINEVN